MKKIALFSFAFLSFSCLAAQARADNYSQSTAPVRGSFYVGAFGGYGWSDVDMDRAGGLDFDADGGEYGAFAGFQIDGLLDKTINRTGIGMTGAVEVYYTESDADDTEAGIKLEKDHDWGIDFRPGLTFLDADSPMGLKPYGIIGYRRANFETSGGGDSTDRGYNGFELGLGSELMAYNAFGVRLDYTHVFYGEKDDIDPSENNLRLGVAYHF